MAKRRAGGGTADRESHEEAAGAGRILEEYLSELRATRATGAAVPETSFYPALSNLFNAVGGTLKPKVRCVVNISNQGAGIPDGGLFTADQFQRGTAALGRVEQMTQPRAAVPHSRIEPKPGQLPARGAIEAKGTKPDVGAIAASDQVKEYVKRYGIVLVTNLREFLIVERGPSGLPAPRESFALAEDEKDFWRDKAAHPRAAANRVGEQFAEFIKRACLHNAPLANPKDVAWFLASYARDALFRVEQRKQLPALQTVRSALEEALGMKFTDEKGEHFFRSTLVQTLFYGVFSAWVRWHKDKPGPGQRFDWQKAEWSMHVPFIRTLYRQLADPHQLGQYQLVEVLDWAAGALNRVDRAAFFKDFEDEHAVQYFYEPFLESYDPELRKQLGVWYTPPEIVKYQVARVDRVLREELDLPDGLADPNVIVLDPCCGTGAYLVEVLHSIAATLRDKGGDALVASDLKDAAMNRVFGFEIMPAPFVVSHLQLGVMLQAQGAPLSHKKGERVGVYLTNALTGWEPPKGGKQKVAQFAELEEERDAAEHVKRDKKILVVLGNPPYNAFAGVSPEEEQGLVEAYKGVYYLERGKKGKDADTSVVKVKHYKLNDPPSLGGWGIKKFNLDDLYVRFFRLAERRIAEMSGKGVVSFISNFSYLGDPSFVVMRQRFLGEFDKLWLDCMNGDSRETGKLTPDGKPDPSVFSTDQNREGIRVGTAICVIVRKPTRQKKPTVRFRHLWGTNKRAELLASLAAKDFNKAYTSSEPRPENGLTFRPQSMCAGYMDWPKVVDLCHTPPLLGLNENRRQALYSYDKDSLAQRMATYFDAGCTAEDLADLHVGLRTNAASFDAKDVRTRLLSCSAFDPQRIVRYAVFPFDIRWAYLESKAGLWNRVRPQLIAQASADCRFLLVRRHAPTVRDGASFYALRHLGDQHVMHKDAYFIATSLPCDKGDELLATDPANAHHANLSPNCRAYLTLNQANLSR